MNNWQSKLIDGLLTRFWYLIISSFAIYIVLLVDSSDRFQTSSALGNIRLNPFFWTHLWNNQALKIKLLNQELSLQNLFFGNETIYSWAVLAITILVFVFLIFIYEPTRDWFHGLYKEIKGETKPVIYKLFGLAWVLNSLWDEIKENNITTLITSSADSDKIPNHALDLEWVNSNTTDNLEQGFIDLFVKEYLEFVDQLAVAIGKNITRLKRESLVIFYDGQQGSGKSSITNLMIDLKLMNAKNIGYNQTYSYFSKNYQKLVEKDPKTDIFAPSPYIYKFDTTQVQNTDNFTKAILDEIE
ncbi:MAG: hypothetical protein H7230_04075 [Candidatus Parcubacteria bacterium]|nr:hypothetical protein [Candidatus Paceibacterota bacterium]